MALSICSHAPQGCDPVPMDKQIPALQRGRGQERLWDWGWATCAFSPKPST